MVLFAWVPHFSLQDTRAAPGSFWKNFLKVDESIFF